MSEVLSHSQVYALCASGSLHHGTVFELGHLNGVSTPTTGRLNHASVSGERLIIAWRELKDGDYRDTQFDLRYWQATLVRGTLLLTRVSQDDAPGGDAPSLSANYYLITPIAQE